MLEGIVMSPLRAFAEGSLFGRINSEDPPVVLALHGWARTHSDFDAVLGGIPSVSLDLPGFGASLEPPVVWGADDYADAVVPVLRTFAKPPLVVGHSFGGRVAASLAARYPDLIDGLLLISVPLLRPPDRVAVKVPRAYRILRRLHAARLMSDERLERARRRYGSADYRAAEGLMRDILVKVVNETYEHHLKMLDGRVRLLWGADDNAVPVSIARASLEILSSRADASIAILPEIGHHVMAEAPEKAHAEIAMLAGLS